MRNIIATALATVVVPGVAVILVPYLILQATGGLTPPQIGVIEVICILLALAGAAMVVWVSVAFVTHGKGTPVPVDPPKNLVAAGLYRFVRNPMYFGALLTLFAEAIFFRSAWILLYAGLVWLALHTFTVLVEEPQLARRFGDLYLEYKAKTPRWIPRPPVR
ncbi:MAG TPA: isoprenylcysteine carboxylmethyltransferase family protein [Anaerolineales bacterium]|nr:isoprenylcysteine carboxylmethyltransferase family protein [Anaerolineales bacterium]